MWNTRRMALHKRANDSLQSTSTPDLTIRTIPQPRTLSYNKSRPVKSQTTVPARSHTAGTYKLTFSSSSADHKEDDEWWTTMESVDSIIGSLMIDAIDLKPVGSRQTTATRTHSYGDSEPKAVKPVTYEPGDRVLFAESAEEPGVPIVYRTHEEKSHNPDRLNLDRRRLAQCPILDQECQLRLLNMQHNLIKKVERLTILSKLIFLDLYDNRIEEISGLYGLLSLRVLMLGKNRIKKIDGLGCLHKLDVLDLHGNEIKVIENLGNLTELRVLNLAGNYIQHARNLKGLKNLAELNLRRNQLVDVHDVDLLFNLQRLFLSYNLITRADDVSCIGRAINLVEVTLDNNPVSESPQYKHNIIRTAPQLKQLDMHRVTEEERRVAMVMAKREEDKRLELHKTEIQKEKRRLAIQNAAKQWENQQTLLPRRLKPIQKSDIGCSVQSLSRGQSTDSGTSWSSDHNVPSHPLRASSPEADSVSHFAELDNETLSVYGSGSLEALDKSWGVNAAGVVTTISFQFVDFQLLVRHMGRLRVRFPNLQTLAFCNTNIHSFAQINALATLRRLDHLIIDHNGNPITSFSLWKQYVLFRLANFSLRTINGIKVTSADLLSAEESFGSLARTASSLLSQSKYSSLLRNEEGADRVKVPVDQSVELVGRACLTYAPANKEQHKERRNVALMSASAILSSAVGVTVKKQMAAESFPSIMGGMVSDAVRDFLNPDYPKSELEKLMRTVM